MKKTVPCIKCLSNIIVQKESIIAGVCAVCDPKDSFVKTITIQKLNNILKIYNNKLRPTQGKINNSGEIINE